MTQYKLHTKTLKPRTKVLSKTWLNPEAARTHPDYPTLEWEKHPSFRLHVKIRQSVDQTYIVSVIDDDANHENATTQQIVTSQVTSSKIGSSGGWVVINMDPDSPFRRIQEIEFCKRVCDVCKVESYVDRNSEIIGDVMRFIRATCSSSNSSMSSNNYGSGVNVRVDHCFITLEFGVQEVYVCYEGSGDNW